MDVFTLKSSMPFMPMYESDKQGNYVMAVQADSIADEHHTMAELYEHRHALIIALCKAYDSYITPLGFPHVRCWKSEKHHDGTSYDGWFILGISQQKIPFNNNDPIAVQHIAYHLPMKYWFKADVLTMERAPYYDGYSPEDVVQRLLKL